MIPDSIIKLLGPVCGPDDNHAVIATGHAIKLDQELGLEAPAGIMLPC